MEKNDQTEEVGKNESAEEDTEGKADNQENQAQKESSEKGESKLYKLPDGREVTADEVFKEYTENLLPEFTRRSQKLKAYEKAEAERKAEAEQKAQKSVEETKLKNVPPDVREAVIQIVKPWFEEQAKQKALEKQKAEEDRQFVSKLEGLEKEFSGKDGRPKFDREEVLKAMQDPKNKNFDPRSKFFELHRSELLDYEVKQALKKQKGGLPTETTGGQDVSNKQPQRKPARTFAEASKRAYARLTS